MKIELWVSSMNVIITLLKNSAPRGKIQIPDVFSSRKLYRSESVDGYIATPKFGGLISKGP